ncbi:MAG: PQQ-binding-like beta-propeller repeat protein [Bryobacteraceae bacterium]|jgi:outer membrane protein assembly factor BamB
MKLAAIPALLPFFFAAAFAENWPQWRGPSANSVSGEKDLPVHWTSAENISWKLPLPARSGSTPVIWGDRIFINVAENGSLYLWCVDRKGPQVEWKKLLGDGDYMVRKQNMSSPSPVTDGKNVWVLTGTGVLKGFDFAGNEIWGRDIQKDYGRFGLNWGYASSPVLYEDSIYVQVLQGAKTRDPSYILRVEKKTGKTLWRTERHTPAIRESPDSYSTPMIAKTIDGTQLIVLGGDVVTGHDLKTGEEIWRVTGFNPQNADFYRTIASATFFDGLVYAPTRERPLQTFKIGGKGDITSTNVLWKFDKGPDVPTPVTDGKYFYSVNDRGIVFCLDAKTGKEIYGGQRMKPGTYSASPVLADGKIYITNEDGLTSVLKAGPQFEILAENNVDDYCLSTIAISEGQLFLRTSHTLYAIGKRK